MSTLHTPGSKVRVIKSVVVEKEVTGLHLPAFDFKGPEGPKKLISILRKFLGSVAAEELWALYLKGSELAAVAQLHIGTTLRVDIDRRTIARHVMELDATDVIMVHARTTNNATPSERDAQAIKQLSEFLFQFGCRVLDHIIVSGSAATQIGDFFPQATSHKTDVNGMATREDLVNDILKKLQGREPPPGQQVPIEHRDPSFPGINLGVDLNDPVQQEKDTMRMIDEIIEARRVLQERRTKGEVADDVVLSISSPKGPIVITDEEDIPSLVRDVVIPLMKGEEPRRDVPWAVDHAKKHNKAKEDKQPTLAEQLKRKDS